MGEVQTRADAVAEEGGWYVDMEFICADSASGR
jgi:hypothetical protein